MHNNTLNRIGAKKRAFPVNSALCLKIKVHKMPKDWKEIDIDELLDSKGSQTAQASARYDRIMSQRNIEATNLLKDKVSGLAETLYRASEGIQNKYNAYSVAQTKQQKKIFWLTVVIALSTAAYTFITWQSVTAMNESNTIQNKLLQIELNKQKEHNKSLNRIGAKNTPPS